jgi:DNA replication and repair protein RecF
MDESLPPVVLTGNNGAGKTNILEAISLLAPGKGLRSAKLSELARKEPVFSKEPTTNVIPMPVQWAVWAKTITPSGEWDLGTGCSSGQEHRQVKVDGTQLKNQAELGSYISILWLTPTMDKLFSGDPASRRRFLDRLVQTFIPEHASLLSDYNYALKQWNTLLREGNRDNSWLSLLEEKIACCGVAIAADRKDVQMRLIQFLSKEQAEIPFPSAEMTLQGVIENALDEMKALDVEIFFKENLKKSRHLVADGGSVSGIHTSDFSILHREKGIDASLCSTGEQKALLISVILSQTKALMQEKGICPLLLLDEVSAHLDIGRREALFELLCALPAQVWMTGTEPHAFSSLSQKAQHFNIEHLTATERAVA